MNFPAYYIVLSIAFIVSLVFYKKIKPAYFRLCCPYLLMNLVVETYGIISKSQGKSNYWIYNISTTIEFGFYFFIFYINLTNQNVRRYIVWVSILFFPFCFINIFFIQGINHFHSITFLAGSFFLICLSVLYFQDQIIKENEFLKNPLKEKMFWIATGVLFFYSVGFFNLGLFEIIHVHNSLLKTVTDLLLNLLNIFLYCTFIIAFLIGNDK